MKKKLLLIICLLGTIGMSLANNNTNRDEITILANMLIAATEPLPFLLPLSGTI